MRRPGEPSAKPLAPCSALQRDILLAVSAIGPASGNAILRRLREEYASDAVELSKSTVYDNVRELSRMGLVVHEDVSGRSKPYALSDRGRNRVVAYRRWVADAVPPLDPAERY